MDYPALILFNDNTVMIVGSTDDINGDVGWSGSSYLKDDLIIDCNLTIGIFTGFGKVDELKALVAGGNILYQEPSEIVLNNIQNRLNNTINCSLITDQEAKLISQILERIGQRSNTRQLTTPLVSRK